MQYTEMSRKQLASLNESLEEEYLAYQAKSLKLNMARGKPGTDQLDLNAGLLDAVTSKDAYLSEDGTECRNYGEFSGIPEAKRLMAVLLDDEPENVIIGGNSSLNLEYDSIARYWIFGVLGQTPWGQVEGGIKWICPVPGYDRHFGICESFGIEMIPVQMDENGPDMDKVEKLVSEDASIKGMWCIPKYSNPSGITYSDEVVKRLASMKTAASDFRIFWDNAYCVHHLYDEPENQDQLLDISKACNEAGNTDRVLKFASMSKVTFPGAGIAGIASSQANLKEIISRMAVQTIGGDKMNQLRHARFLRDAEGIAAHMSKHAAILRPKFDLVDRKLHEGLDGTGLASWIAPRGGYFVLLNAYPGTANRVVTLAKEAGVTMTDAGATWPYKQDPNDKEIRVAPTLPPLDELDLALDIFVCCIKRAAVEKMLA